MADGWIELGGGVARGPIAEDTRVDVKFRNNEICFGEECGHWCWEHLDPPNGYDIVAYRLAEVGAA